MAKSTINTNIFARTEPASQAPGPEEKPKKRPLGVQLLPDEIASLDEIKDELGVNRHQLLQMAIRYFIAQYKAGKVKTESHQVKRIIIS